MRTCWKWGDKYSGTPLYGHPLKTDTRFIRTVSFVPTKSSYIFSKTRRLIAVSVGCVSLYVTLYVCDLMAQARTARTVNQRGKNKDQSLKVWTRKTRLVRYLLHLYCVSDGFRNDFCLWGYRFKFLTHLKSKTRQFRVKEILELLVAIEIENTAINHNKFWPQKEL